MPFEEYLQKAVLEPARDAGVLAALRPAGLHGSLDDLVKVTREFMEPTLVAPETSPRRRASSSPGLAGVIPGLGRFDPNDWGLGFELKDGKQPHFTGTLTSPRTYGHWGASGTLFWVDPDSGLGARTAHGSRLRRLGEGSLARVQRRGGAGANVKKLQNR
jgi:CubicO group peptidase (beta-lactamase class C family)